MAAKLSILASFAAAAALALASPSGAVPNTPLPTPKQLSPASGAVLDAMPPFAWSPVANVDHYEFQLAADPGFNSPVLGKGNDSFATGNTRATVAKTVPNGTYYWRVRSVAQDGSVSVWSPGRMFRKSWTAAASLQAPAAGAALSFGTDALKLAWTAVPGATNYLVQVGSDSSLGSLVYHDQYDPNGIPKVQANNLAIGSALATGSYYWSIIPVDAEGNRGVASPVASFSWLWPSTTTPRVTDLNAAPEVYDPQFSWDPVAGAAKYQVEINSSSDFAPGSKVCCDTATITTSYSPTTVFKDNTFYWRVRAVDPDGNTGVWNQGPSFTKAFDKVPPTPSPAVKNLHLRDNVADPGVDADTGTAGYQTQLPMLTWDWVPGASSYEVDVTPWAGTFCDWGATSHHWRVDTAVNAWTPLGSLWFAAKPYSDPMDVATDSPVLISGKYCARVRARSDRAGFDDVYGDYTYLDPNGLGWAFDFTTPPSGNACTPSCTQNYLGSSDYVTTTTGTTTGRVPYFTWKPLRRMPWIMLKNTLNADAVLLKGKADSPTGNDYSVTTRDYASDSTEDELVLYKAGAPVETYQYVDGDLADLANQINTGSSRISASVVGPAGFRLASLTTAAFNPGITSYYVLVAKDPSFSNLVDYAFTQVPAYAPRSGFGPRTYPDETTLYYWAVLPATNPDGTGAVGNPLLAAAQSFEKQSTPPTRLSPASGAQFYDQPSFRWTPTEGARRYRLQVAQDPSFGNPIDDVTTDSTAYTTNTTYPADTVLYWRVRADDENSVGLTWSTTGTFQKRLAAPVPSASNPTAGEALPVWSWSSVQGAVSYDVQIDKPNGDSQTFTDFRMPAGSFRTLTGTGVFHWRVRAEFSKSSFGSTPGPWSGTQPFTRQIGEPVGLHTDAAPDHVLLSWNPKLGVKSYHLQISGRPDFASTVEEVDTENTAYAPKLSDVAYLSGNQLYWRVAGVDPDGNVGDYAPAQQLSLLPKLKLSTKGKLRKRRRSSVSITVKNAQGTWLKGVAVRAVGAGVKARTVRTNMWGVAKFKLKPSKRGRVLFTAKKPGFQAAAATVRVR